MVFFLGSSLFAQRLSQTVIPSHYSLSLDPNIAQKKFAGEETIDVRIVSPVNAIVLNSMDLDISGAEIISSGKAQQAQVVYDRADEMVRLQVPQPLEATAAQIHLRFRGTLTDQLRGLYLSKSSRREYAVTQFEGTYARMMFPCFDEPSFKATFDLKVSADKNDTAISNGHIEKDEPMAGNRHQITFSTSPKMSTYLLALAIGDWDCLARTVDGVPLRVCAVPERKEYGAFALDVAAHAIQFYDQWYAIKYPFGKLDMVAIPDYEWGGMENTASIFYRDSALLLDEKHASVFRKRAQAVTIAHEIAHQWFGDLVTAAWWDDIWLNEGFATWMSRKPIEAWHPEWNLEEDAAADAQEIINVDSLLSARAIRGNPNTPSEIKEMFDGITYEKGAAILRMLEYVMGSDGMRAGVNAYLAAHAYGNATSTDFWHDLAAASHTSIDRMMPTFVLQPGVPLVTMASACIAGSETLDFAQRRFLYSDDDGKKQQDALWQIPLRIKTGSNGSDISRTLGKPRAEDHLAGCPPWILGNANAVGYYRVQYTSKNLQAVAAAAEKDLNVPERIAFLEDSWASALAGNNPVSDFVDVVQLMRTEENRHIVDAIAEHLDYIAETLLSAQDREGKYDPFVRQQFSALVQKLGWESRPNDTDEKKALRASLLEILGRAGDHDAVAASRKLVDQYMSNSGQVDGTLIGSAFTVMAQNGDHKLYDRFEKGVNTTKSTEAYYHFLYALTAFRQPEFAERTLALIDEGKIRQQDYPRFFGALLANSATREVVWKYLKNHWETLAQKVTSFGGAGAISALGSACSVEMGDDVKQFFTDHPSPGAERTVQQSLERIDDCVAFKHRQEGKMPQWLSAQRDSAQLESGSTR